MLLRLACTMSGRTHLSWWRRRLGGGWNTGVMEGGEAREPGQEVEVDDPYSHPEDGLYYTVTSVPGPGADPAPWQDSLAGCLCPTPCRPPHCPCLAGGHNYVEGRLARDRGLVECGSECRCGPDCGNRLVQRGPSPHLEIRHLGDKGYGVFATAILPEGTFICEYAGEVVGEEEARRREDGGGRQYLLVVREHFSRRTVTTAVDAGIVANVGRYVNHSCRPNCRLVPVRAELDLARPCIFTERQVELGEELSYAYGPVAAPLSRTPCLCGEPDCRRFLPAQATFDNDARPSHS